MRSLNAAGAERSPRKFLRGLAGPLERRARDSNPQPVARHLISSQTANHSHTLRRFRAPLVAMGTYTVTSKSNVTPSAFQGSLAWPTLPSVTSHNRHKQRAWAKGPPPVATIRSALAVRILSQGARLSTAGKCRQQSGLGRR